MPKVTAYLDCGCAILEDGSRTWCPTCMADNALEQARGQNTPRSHMPEALAEIHRLEDAIRKAWGVLYAAIDDSPVIQQDLRPGDWQRLKYGALDAMHELENAMRFHSPRAVDELIVALMVHRKGVWG